MSSIQNTLLFFGKFLRSPKTIGAIAPSGPALARLMVRLAKVDAARAVLELGPGTGSFTREIARSLASEAVFVAIEADPELAAMLRDKLPDVHTVAGSAEHIQRIIKSYGVSQVDSIVSGLPWATFDSQLQDRILYAACESLRPGGTFVTFAYIHALVLPQARRFRDKLSTLFAGVEKSPVVWRNLPPAFVYCCRK